MRTTHGRSRFRQESVTRLVTMIRCTRRSVTRVTGAVLLPLLLAGGPGCATGGWPRFAAVQTQAELQQAAPRGGPWARVRAIAPGAEVELQLQDGRTMRGDFQAAGDDTVTLRLSGGETLAPEQRTVRRVRVRRPVWNRPAGWVALVVATAVVGIPMARAMDLNHGPIAGLMLGAPIAWPFFAASAMTTVYETRGRIATRVEMDVADGDVLRPGQDVEVAVFHGISAGWPAGEPVGVTVCLSSRPAECDGARARYEGPAGDLPLPFMARPALSDRWPAGAPLTLHVHVVVTAGPSWQPARDPRVPRLGDSGVLGAVTVTRRVTVGGR